MTIIGLDGRVIQTEAPAVRLNRLINQALGRNRLALRRTQAAPVDLQLDDTDPLLLTVAAVDELRDALQFARRAS